MQPREEAEAEAEAEPAAAAEEVATANNRWPRGGSREPSCSRCGSSKPMGKHILAAAAAASSLSSSSSPTIAFAFSSGMPLPSRPSRPPTGARRPSLSLTTLSPAAPATVAGRRSSTSSIRCHYASCSVIAQSSQENEPRRKVVLGVLSATRRETADLPMVVSGSGGGGPGLIARATTEEQKVRELATELKRLGGLRMWRQALKLFEGAKSQGLPLTTTTYTHLISVLSKGGRWKEAVDVLEEMIIGGKGIRKEIAPTVVSYNAAITACARAQKWQLALELLQDVERRSGLVPDKYSYGAAMLGLAKSGRSERALQLLEQMRAAGFVPDLVALSLAMEACCTRGAPDHAAEVLAQVRACEHPLSESMMSQVLTSAISSCIKHGAWEQAVGYLGDVRFAYGGKIPPVSAFTATINACARAGQGVRARALLAELVAGGAPDNQPDLECYNAVVAACAMSGDWENAVKVLKLEMPKAGIKPDTKTYIHAIAGCGRAGQWESALSLLNEQRSGKVPNAPAKRESYNEALAACGRAGQVQPCLLILEAMRATARANRRLAPDRASYAGALHACRIAGDSDTALELLATMRRVEKLKPDQRCLLAAVAACLTVGRSAAAADVLEGMVKENVRTSEGGRDGMREMCQPPELEDSRGGGGGSGAGSGRSDHEGLERCLAALEVLDRLAAEFVAKAATGAAAASTDADEATQDESGGGR